ncbi:alpha/beta fold hydrolase [Gulosibacter sediminis]|uniref:alpha/beta hydrolase family protein n=1 Tax=Gulosibacter sediminis TaxID=1729695 RepID=UPI001F3B843F|nr:alpha/beta fold hydrolase [Gulosibacter sediminis]
MSSASTSSSERLAISVGGDTIAGTLWRPAGTPTGVVIVNPATATPERFYSTFTEYLTSRGLAAVTYDYRGTGASGDPRRHKHLRMRDWMQEDVPAVAEWAWSRFPAVPVTAVGHSIGGHAMALGNGVDDVARFAIVSSHVAHTKRIEPAGERHRVGAILGVVGPTLSRTLGYMPGKRLGLGEDLPAAAMIERGPLGGQTGLLFRRPEHGCGGARRCGDERRACDRRLGRPVGLARSDGCAHLAPDFGQCRSPHLLA